MDPFELLRDLNPVAPDELADAASSAEARRALEDIVAGTHNPPPRWGAHRPHIPQLRRRTYLLAFVPLAGAIAAAAWALTHGATNQLAVGCYANADLQAHTVVVPAGAGTALDACRAVWRRGDFGLGQTPRLQACVLPSGAIGVFPSTDEKACIQLQLTPVTSTTTSTTPTTASPLELKTALVRIFLADRCLSEQRAVAATKAEIERLGLTDWQVQVNGTFTSTRPCASLAFDEQAHRVLLVPVPKQP